MSVVTRRIQITTTVCHEKMNRLINRVKLPSFHPVVIVCCLASMASPANPTDGSPGQADIDRLVSETRTASLKLREDALRKTIAKDKAWPHGTWGDNLWCLAALSLNEKTDEANERLRKAANAYIKACHESGGPANPTPEENTGAPWTFFSITDYVRMLCMFHANGTHFPGRLKPETEAAMKESLWLWTSTDSRIADYGADDTLLLLGTENHDLNKRPVHYLVTSLLKDDATYRDRKLADGHTTAEHAAAHTAFFREWPRTRAASGMWIEVGSNSYQKYSWPALFNLHELSPDPVVRHRFGLLLDLALIEEAQISVKGRRGGGRSRAYHKGGGFEPMKAMLFGEGGGSAHSRVIEASRYQAPAEAILLHKRVFPADKPFLIRNLVLGKLGAGEGHRIDPESQLVNYAWRTPHFLLGSTLQNPAIEYSGISKQNRACGMLFDDPSSSAICQVYPSYEHVGGGRPQHSFWSVQHENVLLVQRINRVGKGHPGSYNTGRLGVRFDVGDLTKVEEHDWIFSGNGKAFVGVKFLDGGHAWDETKTLANPANFVGNDDTTRILIHAGDISSHGTFETFKANVLASRLSVTPEKADYEFEGGDRIEMNRYDAKAPANFVLPRINGKPVNLRPEAVYESPFLNAKSGSDKITVTVGPMTRVLDFSNP